MRILFIGDIVGEPGRRAVKGLVPRLRLELSVNLVIANGENMAGGSGITPRTADEVFTSGVDVITSGDHIWDMKEIVPHLAAEPRILRPLNYPSGAAGHGSLLVERPGQRPVAVLNAQGRTFLADLDNPFHVVPPEIARLREITPVVFLDFHAEATSEKIAMARLLDGQASAVIGTHTHVQTADEQIFPGGTAYLTDAGFTGPHDSVLGRDIEPVIRRFLTNMPQKFSVAEDRILLQGALVDVDEGTGRARQIERVSRPYPAENLTEPAATR